MATSIPNLSIPRPLLPTGARLFLQFTYLQALDILTTLAFLLAGVQEGNPLVRAAIRLAGTPMTGLIVVKCAALAMGLLCWLSGRDRLLGRANLFFACLVAWNLFCLILGLAARL